MQGHIFTVKYVTVQNCFVYLPDTWQREFTSKPNVVKVTHKDRDLFFSWHSRPSPDDSIRLSATFARVLGIQEGDHVSVDCFPDPGSVSRVRVVPRNSQDWEIVELQSARIQESLLNQIKVVAVNQEIVVWISKFLSVVLNVEYLEPSYKYGKLELLTEVEVSLPKPADEVQNTKNEEESKSSVWNLLKNFVPSITSPSFEDGGSQSAEESVDVILKKYSQRNFVQTFRVLPLKIAEYGDSTSPLDSLFYQPYNVFVKERFLRRNSPREFYCRLKRVKENTQFVASKITNTNFLRSENRTGFKLAEEILARVFVVEDVLKKCSNNVDREYFDDNSTHPGVYVSENLRKNLKLKIGGKVTMESGELSQGAIEGVEIYPESGEVSMKDFEDYFRMVSEYRKVLVNSSSRLILAEGKSCVVRILPVETGHALIDFYELKNLRVQFREAFSGPVNQLENLDEQEKDSLKNISTRGLRPILSESETVLRLSLGLDRTLDFGYDRENILICGKIGSGKSTVCRILKETFKAAPSFVHFNEIDCKALKGKRVEILQKTFLPAILDCVYHQPSILFVDNLESIAGRTVDDEENTPDSINTARIADMLLNLITEYQGVHHVAVVATCVSTDKISQKLAAPRGIHLFRTILVIPDFEKEDRIDILRLSLKSKLQLSKDIDWNDYGNKTEGWMPQDVTNFSEKAVFTAWKRHVKSGSKASPILEEKDLCESLKNSIPMSLQGIGLYSGPGHAWSDIGGLSEAKQSLIEILHWPLKYPELFKNAPIRHQGGVLLYGAPGTGKTMLAGAVAKECGLSFISVKGPELLSKYIGASEEAVRNVFEKANSAKPCILFFDEFDSLAPRRGQDSTGVTDRVVNQFLAQLDGVEGRQGVAVVAASSRPDLLDPALLRPGRLDKALLCPLPNEEEREEILVALSRSQRLDLTLLDLKMIAKQTPGFTGADLNSIISQARLSALEEHLADMKSLGEGEKNSNTVTQRHLIDALASSRPSLSPSEKSKYDRIYSKFSRIDEGSFSSNKEILGNNQRTTLA